MQSVIFYQLSFLHLVATTVLLFAWMMCFNSSYLFNIIVCSSFVKYAALLPVDLSMFVSGHMLQTPPLLCERARG